MEWDHNDSTLTLGAVFEEDAGISVAEYAKQLGRLGRIALFVPTAGSSRGAHSPPAPFLLPSHGLCRISVRHCIRICNHKGCSPSSILTVCEMRGQDEEATVADVITTVADDERPIR